MTESSPPTDPRHGHALHPASIVVAAGRPPRGPGAAVNAPLSLSSTFQTGGDIGYLRDGSSTVVALESVVGALDGGAAVAFTSGMAAIAAVFDSLPMGATVVAPRSMYWGSVNLLRTAEGTGRLRFRPVDQTDTEAVLSALPGADVVWVETPSNPLIEVVDLPVICDAARDAGVLSCVDATLATPLLLKPLAHGADVVMHSATKYLAGHSDLVAGVLVCADGDRAEAYRGHRSRTGAVPGALEAFLALRGLRTLDVRLSRQQDNARELAARLAAHPAVARVRFPGLADDPGHDRCRRLMNGPGAVLSFELAGGADAADAACARVALITHATSLGGVESLMERRAVYAGERQMGTPPALLRLSVGIENVEDLWSDLAQALA